MRILLVWYELCNESTCSVKYMFINLDLVNIQSVFNLSISLSLDFLYLYFLTPYYMILKVTERKCMFDEYIKYSKKSVSLQQVNFNSNCV
jgi:hypothetical protein